MYLPPWLRRAAVCLLVMMCDHVRVGAQVVPGPALFLDAAAPDAPAPNGMVVRERFVRPRLDLFESDPARGRSIRRDRQLVLNLFPDAIFTATLDAMTVESSEAFVWLGHLEGPAAGTVTLAVRAGVMAGELRTATELYEIRLAGGAAHAVRQVNPGAFPADGHPVRPNVSAAAMDEAVLDPLSDDGSLIDVMVLYTPAARIARGGTAAMEAEIDLAIANTNTSYANSGVIQRVRLVHRSEIAYSEVDFYTDLEKLTGTSDGVMDNVHAMRNTYKADLVALVTNRTELCGLAWLMPVNSTASAPYGFSVNYHACIGSNLTLAHEMGHNMGLNHDLESPPGPFPYTYGRGYSNGISSRDVMSVSSGVPRRQNFSNPAVNFVVTGDPSGTADRNGALALNNTRLAVANFRIGDPVVPAEGDYNGDGQSDVLWRNSSGQTTMWLMNGATITSSGALLSADSNWRSVGNGDHNGDGRADILWRHTSGDVVAWFMNGTTIAGGGNIATVDPAYSIVGTGDYNADGRADIVWRHSAGSVVIWLMNGIQVIGGGVVATVDPSWSIRSTGDLNGDGRADILWRHSAGGTTVWLMSGIQVVGGGAIATVDPSWLIVGTADYNADGRRDILWRHTNGELAMWFMNGTLVIGGGGIGTVDTAWQVAGRGSYDVGGRPDILWRHTTGQAVIWFMNGMGALSGSAIGSMDPSWQIVDPGQPPP
jgi:hypothetical protein